MKLILDIILLFLFGILCNTGVTGTAFHEIAGLVYAGLISIHLVLNSKWIAAALKGKLRGSRSVIMSSVNIALLVDLLVILATGIRASHFLFSATIKASSLILVIHAVGGVIAAGLVLAHVLLHTKMITKKKIHRKIAFAVVLIISIGYSLYGSVQGALHHGLSKDNRKVTEQHYDNGGQHPKDGEKK
jgi:hypothetical protein